MFARIAVVLAHAVFLGQSAFAAEIRADAMIDGLAAAPQPYVVVISDCDSVVKATEQGSDASLVLERITDRPSFCEGRFSADGAQRLAPSVTVTRLDGAEQIIAESFPTADNAAPELLIDDVAVETSGDGQFLVLTASAEDDHDLRQLSVSLVGIRASALRAAGGVVSEATDNAFAKVDNRLVYPAEDGQTQFRVAIPVTQELAADVIAMDALAIIDVAAVDAYGNQTSQSELRFIGDEISEGVSGMQVMPTKLVLTSPVQKPALVPVVDFQFRGQVALAGAGAGVSYRSSHPDLVGVSPSGVVYALNETGTNEVYIQVSYPGAEDVRVPVSVDFSVSVDAVLLAGVAPGSPLILPRLNRYLDLPAITLRLSNGEQIEVPSNWQRTMEILSGSALLEANRAGQLRARGVIDGSAPARVRLSLPETSGATLEFEVLAQDAPPEVTLEASASVVVGEELMILAKPTDDVGIERVDFLIDGAPVATRRASPYSLVVPVGEPLLGKTLVVSARATDSRGNSTMSIERKVMVVAPPAKFSVDNLAIKVPAVSQRVIEGAPMGVWVERYLGEQPEDFTFPVSRLLFQLDGKRVGELSGGTVEKREEGMPAKTRYYQVWKGTLPLPSISVRETSQALTASAAGFSDGDLFQFDTRLVRIVQNSPPSGRIASPVEGAAATAGSDLAVRVEYSDDMGTYGTVVELLDGSEVIASQPASRVSLPFRDALNPTTEIVNFAVKTNASDIGKRFKLRLRVTDYHGKTFTSDLREVPLVGDQPPTVAISSPAQGSSHVAGLPLTIRATAVDDVAVERVDFIVDGRLVGSDYAAPYAVDYPTPVLTGSEQRLSLLARVFDSGGQQGDSSPIQVVLGKDESAPIINVASPTISETGGALDLAPVLEDQVVVLKFAGYDNVGVERVELTGIRSLPGGGWQLTGQSTDRATSADIPLQRLPGALNAWSMAALLRTPLFTATPGTTQDVYQVTATAFDKAGNRSMVNFGVAVRADQAPAMVRLEADKPAYNQRDTLRVTLVARDDKAVTGLRYRLMADGVELKAVERSSAKGDFVAMTIVQDRLDIALEALRLLNQDLTLQLEVVAIDERGQISAPQNIALPIKQDKEGPRVELTAPPLGTTLTAGATQLFSYEVEDDSAVASLRIRQIDGPILAERSVSGEKIGGSFSVAVASDATALQFEVSAVDIFGNRREKTIQYQVAVNQPPQISIRQPAPGSRLQEGELTTLNFALSDDDIVTSVRIFVQRAGGTSFERTFSASQIAAAVANSSWLSALVPIPTKPLAGEDFLFAIEAVDSRGGRTVHPVDIEVVDDTEAPIVQMTLPETALSLLPGSVIKIAGTAIDNNSIDRLELVVRDQDGQEDVLPWDKALERQDQREEVRVANPDSLGNALMGQRTVTHFKGSVTLPKAWLVRAGKAYSLFVRAVDFGPNATASNSVVLNILGDAELPRISLNTPNSEVVEQTKVEITGEVADNLGLELLTVELLDGVGSKELLRKEIAGDIGFKLKELWLPLEDYRPTPEHPIALQLRVMARDIAGNEAVLLHNVSVVADQAPEVELSLPEPQGTVVKGAPLFQRLTVRDDALVDDNKPRFLPFASSLSGLDGARGLRGLSLLNAGSEEHIPGLRWAYPEATTAAAILEINGSPVLQLAGESELRPLPNAITNLAIKSGADVVSYRVTIHSKDPCVSSPSSVVINSPVVDLAALATATTTYIEVTPQYNGQDASIQPLKRLRVYRGYADDLKRYKSGTDLQQIDRKVVLEAEIADGGHKSGVASLQLYHSVEVESRDGAPFLSQGMLALAPEWIKGQEQLSVYAHAIDRFSHLRAPQPLSELYERSLLADEEQPAQTLENPFSGMEVVNGQVIAIQLNAKDNSAIHNVSLVGNDGQSLFSQGGKLASGAHHFQWQVPINLTPGTLNLSLVATDVNGHLLAEDVLLPVKANAPPQISLSEFSSYKVGTSYLKNYRDQARLALNEFWVRNGEQFNVGVIASDDAGLAAVSLSRVDISGRETLLHQWTMPEQCPDLPRLHFDASREIVFDQTTPTQYLLRVLDRSGQQAERRFIVNPELNIAPELRIASPINNQLIATGTFEVRLDLVATDDRRLSAMPEVYVNGKQVGLRSIESLSLRELLPDGSIVKAFNEIYDSLEHGYGIAIANDYGRPTSPYAMAHGYRLVLPAGIEGEGDTLEIEAAIRDSDGATTRHRIDLKLAPDEVKPEVALYKPEPGARVVEASFFDASFAAYDNVKVTAIELSAGYGALTAGGYVQGEFGAPLRVVDSIPAEDFNRITTVNIDTPVYNHRVAVKRLPLIAADLGVDLSQTTRVDLWLKLVARDAGGNIRERLISIPVRVDERPVVDIVGPEAGRDQVEEATLTVNVNAHDDVAVDSVRLIARNRGAVFKELVLKAPPYAYSLTLPGYDSVTPANNFVELEVIAIDSYGAAIGDADKHTATEKLSFSLVPDQGPAVTVASPANGSSVIEGQALVIEIAAVDDVAIDRVAMSIEGLTTGPLTSIDYEFPFEFLVSVPYGQAGKPLIINATATEQRKVNPRTAETKAPVVVNVTADTEAPVITPRLPVSGGSGVEGRPLAVQFDALDNVKVVMAKSQLLVDRNQDGSITLDEVMAERVFIGPPYVNDFTLAKLTDYVGKDFKGSTLAAQVRVTGRDGAGNEAAAQVPVTIIGNQPPTVTAINILDKRGYNLGSGLDRIAEGREIVVAVTAEDLEAGVDRVRLQQALGAEGALVFNNIGEDVVAPYQFHISVPKGQRGKTLAFRATAVDVDGNESSVSAPRVLVIEADQPPKVEITQPANDRSAVIAGQLLRIVAKVEDDLGPEGVQKVDFLVNDQIAATNYQSLSADGSTFGQDNLFAAEVAVPEGVDGVVVQAVAHDVMGHSSVSQVVRVGVVADTVAPQLEVLSPVAGEVITAAEVQRIAVQVRDIGEEANRTVSQRWIREYQDRSGDWHVLAQRDLSLVRDDERRAGDTRPVSVADQHRYVYVADLAAGDLLRRDMRRNERVRVITQVKTEGHEASDERVLEVGLPLDRQRYVMPSNAVEYRERNKSLARSIYYSALARYQGPERTGALLAAWNTLDPALLEQGLGGPATGDIADAYGGNDIPMRTGIFMLDAMEPLESLENGEEYLYSELLVESAETFLGAISAIHADVNYVLAAKAGLPDNGLVSPSYAGDYASVLQSTIAKNPETGGNYLENGAGELLTFNHANGDGQFGLPYLLAGRVDMPYPDVHNVVSAGHLAFVANGHGGVQVVDITVLNSPYRVSFIKPNGYVRDVAVVDNYLYIAASEEGVVVADISTPSMPIVATIDTLGVANRLAVQGQRLYVANMSGSGRASQLDIFDISAPHQPALLRSVEFAPTRKDRVADGVYDLFVSGNLAYLGVLESDQEDKPAETRVETLKLGLLEDAGADATVPIVVHRQPSLTNYSVRDLVLVDGALEIASGMGGVARAGLAELAVVRHSPLDGQSQVNSLLPMVEIELSAVLDPTTRLVDNVRVYAGEWPFAEDLSAQFDIAFGLRRGEPAYRFITVTPKAGVPWSAGTTYHVQLLPGLLPLGGDVLRMSDSYRFSFTISAAGAAMAPQIASIVPNVGDVNGATQVVISGHHFGEQPKVTFGEREAVVESIRLDAGSGLEQLTVIAPANYAGPASVTVVNDEQLKTVEIGAFTYTDGLQISYIEPGVVGVNQTGEGDRVAIIGYGFHRGIQLKAWPSEQPDKVTLNRPDGDRLTLVSPQRMEWRVPDLGSGYRGFVDVEISDDSGRRYWLPRALFYGKLEVGLTINTSQPPPDPKDDDKPYVPDAGRLPPGLVKDVVSDSERNLIYVLGRGLVPSQKLLETTSTDTFRRKVSPGWISLIHYQRDNLLDAAPMHGLGYMNLPQALAPVSMVLADEHLYVAAHGYDFPFIEVPYEGHIPCTLSRESRKNSA